MVDESVRRMSAAQEWLSFPRRLWRLILDECGASTERLHVRSRVGGEDQPAHCLDL